MEKIAERRLHDLFENCSEEERWREKRIVETLSCKGKPLFRVPSADTAGTEVFFDNLEMLARYASLPLPDQRVFCEIIGGALRRNLLRSGANLLRLRIKWSETEEKILCVRLVGTCQLDIYVEC